MGSLPQDKAKTSRCIKQKNSNVYPIRASRLSDFECTKEAINDGKNKKILLHQLFLLFLSDSLSNNLFFPAPTCKRFHFFFIPVLVELVDRHCPTSLIIIYSRGKLVTVAKQRLDWGRGLRQTKCWLNLSLRTAWCLILTLTLTLTLDLWSLLFGRSWTESIQAA